MNFQSGTCASEGYTHEDGEQHFPMPEPIGDVEVDLFSKPENAQQPHKHWIRTFMKKLNKATGHVPKAHRKHHHENPTQILL